MRLTTRIFATSLLLATGCDPLTGADDDSRAGEVQFRYSGAYSGTFNAGGDLSPTVAEIKELTEGRGSENTYLRMTLDAVSPRTAPRGDLFRFYILGAERRTFTRTCGFSSGGGTAPPCATMSFVFNEHPSEAENRHLTVFSLDSGTVTITALTRDRVRGTFSGRLQQYSEPVPLILSITGGRFDVPLRRIP